MTVYADVIFAVNTAVNYLLLLLGAKLTVYAARPRRAFLGAALGGIYAVCVVLPALAFFGMFWGKTLCFFLMSAAAYGFRKKAVKPCAVFFLCTCALAGVILLLSRVLPAELVTFGGNVYYPAAQKMLLLMAGGFYLAAALLLTGSMKHGAGEVVSVQLERGERCVCVSALYDTGNTLSDPVTGKPVVVVEWARGMTLLDAQVPCEFQWDALRAMEYLQAACCRHRLRLVPYRAVGTESGLLLAVPCFAKIGRRKRTEVLAAFSPSSVSDGGGYEALSGGTLI